jgi:hypothetical protein
MTTHQLHVFNLAYLIGFAIVAFLTRARARRIAGAVAGGVASGFGALGIVTLGERAGWWHFTIRWEPYFLTLLLLGVAVSGFIFLISWRIARRFGGRGLAFFGAFMALIGPPRDYWYMRQFPEWGHYAPGIAPVLAISATYVSVLLIGHGVMWLVAGPSREDRLGRRPWESHRAVDATDARHSSDRS